MKNNKKAKENLLDLLTEKEDKNTKIKDEILEDIKNKLKEKEKEIIKLNLIIECNRILIHVYYSQKRIN